MNSEGAREGALETPAKKSNVTIRRGTDNVRSQRRAFCSADVYRRRRYARELDELLTAMYPAPTVPPSTFGLTPGELVRHAADLARLGWALQEITSALALDDSQAVPR